MEILDTASSPENGVCFSDVEIAIVKKALHTKLFRRSLESLEVRLPKFQTLVSELSEVFGIPEVRLTTGPVREVGYAKFKAESNTIETEQFLSLVTTLFGFALALHHHKPEMAPNILEMLSGVSQAGKLMPLAFALSAYKQAAPRMFEDAKLRGRLVGTTTPYTDDGRLPASNPINGGDEPATGTGEDSAPEGATTDLPAPQSRRIQHPQTGQQPDIDPENSLDRGNGRGED
jgi:hypothetical protein